MTLPTEPVTTPGPAEITEGTMEANGLHLAYLAAGPIDDTTRPLAMCLHGFPDSARTWRHLLPELAAAGYRAVAPWLRGYAPSAVPEDGCYQSGMVAVDVCALHDALEGGDGGVLIGHDWGALVAYGAVHDRPGRWDRLVTMAVPPPGALASAFLTYDQLRMSWYMFFFQHPLSDIAVAQDDLAFIDRLWADWSPGYDAAPDLPHVKDALRDPANLAAALGYYRAMLGNVGISDDPQATALQAAANQPLPLPTLYLHGRTDGCMTPELAKAAEPMLAGDGSRVAMVDDAGHFLHLERPQHVNDLVLGFLRD